MKLTYRGRPQVEVTLLDSQRKPLLFSYKRLAILQNVATEIPELPVSALVNNIPRQIPIEMIDFWDMKLINMMNQAS